MAFVLGLNHKLYYQSTGTRATWPGTGAAPNLVLIDDSRDVTFNGEGATADVSTRGGGGFRQTVSTLNDATVDFQVIYDPASTAFAFLRDAWVAKTIFGIAILDGLDDTVGTEGFWFDCVITGFTKNEALEEAGMVDITAANTLSAVPFETITVA